MAGIALVASTDAMRRQADRWLPSLAPYELQRWRAFRSEPARDSYLAAHLLVRLAAARATGATAHSLVLAQRCDECGGEHGRPFFPQCPGLHVSLSHDHAAVAAVAADHQCAIDVEGWGSAPMDESAFSHAFSDDERAALARIDPAGASPEGTGARAMAALRLWVRKECLVKLGRLSLDTLAACSLPVAGAFTGDGRCTADSMHGGLACIEWFDPHTRTLGAAACTAPVELCFMEPWSLE